MIATDRDVKKFYVCIVCQRTDTPYIIDAKTYADMLQYEAHLKTHELTGKDDADDVG